MTTNTSKHRRNRNKREEENHERATYRHRESSHRRAAIARRASLRPGPGGGPGGPRRGKRQYFRKKKVCRFCVERVDFIDYKKVEMLQPFVQDRGKIMPRRMTGTCSRHQRWLGVAIKRARNIALLPFHRTIDLRLSRHDSRQR